MTEQKSKHLNESNNIQGQPLMIESISYSRIFEEADIQEIDQDKMQEKPAPQIKELLNPNQRHKNPPILQKPQERQKSLATVDGLKIQINYLPEVAEKNSQKDSKIQKVTNTIPNYMYSSSPSNHIPEVKGLKGTQLGPIPQTQTEHKRSDEEPNEQKTITEIEVHGFNKAGSLYSFINSKSPLAIQKSLMQQNKSINQSQPNDCTKRQLDDSVELVVNNNNHHQIVRQIPKEENPIKASKTKTAKESDKKIHTSYTTASKLAKKQDFANIMVQSIQRVQSALITMSLHNPKSPEKNQHEKQRLTEQPFLKFQFQKKKDQVKKEADEKSNLLMQSKSMGKLKKSDDRLSNKLKQPFTKSNKLQDVIRSSVWIKLLSSRITFNEQLNNCLVEIGKLLDINPSYTVISLDPFIVIYAGSTILQISQSKKIYIGEYKQYKGLFIKQGKGTQIDPLRSIYIGYFRQGIKEGNGKIFKLDNYTYDGQWKSGVKEGKGVLIVKGKSKFKGQFMNDKKHGLGIQEFFSGNKYEGQFQNNAFHGKGVYYWKGEARYTGDFMNGSAHGQGIWISERGDFYEGTFVNGRKQGYGVYSWKDGKIYKGEFPNESQKKRLFSKLNTQRQIGDAFLEKRSLSPKRYKIYF